MAGIKAMLVALAAMSISLSGFAAGFKLDHSESASLPPLPNSGGATGVEYPSLWDSHSPELQKHLEAGIDEAFGPVVWERIAENRVGIVVAIAEDPRGPEGLILLIQTIDDAIEATRAELRE